ASSDLPLLALALLFEPLAAVFAPEPAVSPWPPRVRRRVRWRPEPRPPSPRDELPRAESPRELFPREELPRGAERLPVSPKSSSFSASRPARVRLSLGRVPLVPSG